MKKPDKATLLQLYAKDGLTDVQVAKRLGVNPSTVWRWRKSYGIELTTEQLYRVRLKKG